MEKIENANTVLGVYKGMREMIDTGKKRAVLVDFMNIMYIESLMGFEYTL